MTNIIIDTLFLTVVIIAAWQIRLRNDIITKLKKELDEVYKHRDQLMGQAIRGALAPGLEAANEEVVAMGVVMRGMLGSATSPFGVYTGQFKTVSELAMFLLFDEDLDRIAAIRARAAGVAAPPDKVN